MWSCPNCRSRVDDSLGVCGSCGTSPEGDERPSRSHAGRSGPIPDSPGTDPASEPQVELPEPPPELVDCYSTGDQADAALMAQYLEGHGIATWPTLEPRALTSQEMSELGRVLIRPQDLPRARRLIRQIAKRRAQRQRLADRSAESPWYSFAAVGFMILTFWTLFGVAIGDTIAGPTHGEPHVYQIVGGGLGCVIGLALMIWLYRIRRRADARLRVEKAAVDKSG